MARHESNSEQWDTIRSRLPQRRGPRSDEGDLNFINAVVWIARTGVPRRDLDDCFGPWKRIYNRFRRWSRREWWLEIFRGTAIEENVGSILDGSVVRAHQDAAGGRHGQIRTCAIRAYGSSAHGFGAKR